MYEIQIIVSCILASSYLIASYLIIRENKSLVNLLFAFSTCTLALATILALLGYLTVDGYIHGDYIFFWQLGTIILILSPSGFFFSAKTINYGKNAFTQLGSFIWGITSFFIIVGIILIYPLQTELENILIWDPLVNLLLLGVSFEFYHLYRLNSEWRNKIGLIIVGFYISIIGMGLDTLIIILTGDYSPILRQVPPLIGLALVISAFIVIPASQRTIQDWTALNIQNKEMQLLVDLLTHDLTNHLFTSEAFLDYYLKDFGENNEDHSLLKSKAGIQRALSLIKTVSILMITKLNLKDRLHQISLRKAVDDSITVINDLFPSENVEIEVAGIMDSDTVLADSLFDHLLINLLNNAVKNDENERISIIIRKEEISPTKFRLLIIDNGIGIPSEKRIGIFDRYSQFRSEGKGSGLGLFIVNTLINNYKGSIEIMNTVAEDFSKGTTFVLTLFSGIK